MDGSSEKIYGWMRGVNSLIKNFTSSQTLDKDVSKHNDPKKHYLPSLCNTKQAPYTILVARIRIKHFTQTSN
jgi:hypothetical protein